MNIETFASSGSGAGAGMLIVWLIIIVLGVAGLWATFQKAGKPGWAAIIPVYNVYVLMKVAGRPGWWLILFFIPFINIIFSLIIAVDIAKLFGKSTAFAVIGLWIFSIIGYLMLGFGDAKYQGAGTAPTSSSSGPTPPPAAPTDPNQPTPPTAPPAAPPATPQPPVVQ